MITKVPRGTQVGGAALLLSLLALLYSQRGAIRNLFLPGIGEEQCSGVRWASGVGWFKMDGAAGYNAKHICLDVLWEPRVMEAFEQYLYGQGAALDVGVWMGYDSVKLAKLAAPHRVLSLEADPWAVGRARENLRLNNARNVDVVRANIVAGFEFVSKNDEFCIYDEIVYQKR